MAQAMGLLQLGKVSWTVPIKANASKHKAMSWSHANKLEEQLRAEVTELFAQAEQADTEAQPSLDIPEELKRREDRLAAIAQAKAEIERRAQVRDEAERAEKLERRRKKEKETGKKMGGRPPQAPTPGPRKQDQVNFTRGITHHAVNGRLRAGLQRASGSGCGQAVVTNHVEL